MKFDFDHTHYVPVLRLKRGERVALMNLTSQVRARITPLLELVVTKETSPLTISDNVRRQWGPSPFFLDDMNWPESETGKIIVSMSDAMRSRGLLAIPVTGLDRSKKHQSAVAKIAAMDLRGVCVRLCPDDLQSSSLGKNLEQLLSLLGVQPEQADLIADYRVLSDSAMLYAELCERLSYLRRWRTFTVVSGAFARDLRKYEKNGEYTRPRDDWAFWSRQVIESDLKRRPTYGDYTIQYGFFEEPPARANVSASIRYTAPEDWVIMRGEGLRNPGGPGYDQYAAHAKLLYLRKEFFGKEFSYGDMYIDRLRNRLDGTGSPETLIRAGVNHHITLVVNQISNLFGTSTGDGLSGGSTPNQRPPQGANRSGSAAYAGDSSHGQVRPAS